MHFLMLNVSDLIWPIEKGMVKFQGTAGKILLSGINCCKKKKTEGAYHNEAKFQRWEVKTPQTKNSLTGYHDILKSHDWGVNNHI